VSDHAPHIISQRSHLKACGDSSRQGLSDRGNNKVTQAIKTIKDVGN